MVRVDFATFWKHLGYGKQPAIQWRLKPGWTKEKILQYVSKGIFWIEQDLYELNAREAFYELCDTIPEERLFRLAKKHPELSPEYDLMTFEEMDKWKKLFRENELI